MSRSTVRPSRRAVSALAPLVLLYPWLVSGEAAPPRTTTLKMTGRLGGGNATTTPADAQRLRRRRQTTTTRSTSSQRGSIPSRQSQGQIQAGRDLSVNRPSHHCPLLPRRTLPPNIPPYRPLVIGHRGASYNVPEHTLAGYRLALELGADFIEPDLVPTSDGVLVAVHSVDLNLTTDVARVFPDRYRLDVEHDSKSRSGYFVMDFTLDEVRHLKVRQRVEDTPARSRALDWVFGIPTLDEIVDLLWEWNTRVRPYVGADSQRRGGRPGLYAELKYPQWIREYTKDMAVQAAQEEGREYNGTGVDTADLLVETLASNPKSVQMFFNSTFAECGGPDIGYDTYRVPPLVVQCFEKSTLNRVREAFRTDPRFELEPDKERLIPPMVLLAGTRQCSDPDFWFDVGEMELGGVGPDKACLLDGYGTDGKQKQAQASGEGGGGGEGEGGAKSEEEDAQAEPPKTKTAKEDRPGREFIKSAMEHNLAVHVWTERLEVEFVDTERFDSAEEELRHLFCELGVDGIFAENVDVGVRVASMGCGDGGDDNSGSGGGSGGGGAAVSSGSPSGQCPAPSDSSSLVVAAVALGLLGFLLGSLLTYYANAKWSRRRMRRGVGRRTMAVPSHADDHDDHGHHHDGGSRSGSGSGSGGGDNSRDSGRPNGELT